MDRSFRAFCRQDPTMQTLISNRRLWRLNIISIMATFIIATDWLIY